MSTGPWLMLALAWAMATGAVGMWWGHSKSRVALGILITLGLPLAALYALLTLTRRQRAEVSADTDRALPPLHLPRDYTLETDHAEILPPPPPSADGTPARDAELAAWLDARARAGGSEP